MQLAKNNSLFPFIFSVLMACKPQAAPMDETFSGCDPIDPALCAFPFPSDHFTVDADTPSGKQVRFFPNSLPKNIDGFQVKPDKWNQLDGFSVMGGAVFFFENVAIDNLISHEDLEAFRGPNATTVLINTQTGERVPHFVELDMSGERDAERTLILRPVVPLDYGVRYVVGVRGLKTTTGAEVAVSEAFLALRDNTPTTNWDIEYRRTRFDTEVFNVLEAEGFARADLQLAWDYTTASRGRTLGKVEWMRDDMLARLPEGGPPYEWTNIETADCSAPGQTWGKRLYGKMTVPLYTDIDRPGAFLTRDESGMPFYNGETQPFFVVNVPCSVLENPEKVRLLQYGHGLLGEISEANSGWLMAFSDEKKFISFALNWTGMSAYDAGKIKLMLVDDISDFAFLPERVQQGFVEWVAAVEMVKGAMATDPEVMVDGIQLFNTEDIVYYGNSQGGILGGAYLALSPDIKRGVLGVTGTPYHLLLSRSYDFDPFFLIFKTKFADDREIAFDQVLMQQLWDPAEASGWLKEMGDKQVLLHVAKSDAQVSTLGAHIQARAYGAKLVQPALRPVWGLEEVEGGFVGSALVEFDYRDVASEPLTNTPPDPLTDPHECPRRDLAGQAQIWEFFESGTILQTCDGVCGAETVCR